MYSYLDQITPNFDSPETTRGSEGTNEATIRSRRVYDAIGMIMML